ncbi:SusC/RagA family TonB-linked outer membrane protein [Adhaeribacter aerolatus]|uniref:SusC/RagA family TonB-linked outer membrane protein n=1 Tax=Adhaeribacter aerolatus TaxID=670289 RepID=A0A512AXT4_9BACT|nr:TonB-dependent receptor [Adhaeribacter aerolatus]GEO04500.1 SusC/RagA family TonB-linked outer membrane protein [Adhaeribacter aerolatus]
MHYYLLKELKHFLVLPLLFLTITGAWAQGITVQGKVTDENNSGMPGVTVLLKGTSTGAAAGADGSYSIDVPSANGTLVFSFMGYQTQEVPINNRTTINVQMGVDAKALEEVVVVGYGTQKRSDITGSVASVPKERLSNLPVTDLTQAIQGTTAGLNISQGSSVPGSSGGMSIRGVNSISANTSPFIVLDGAPFFGQINDVNPNDIESIEILKDASAVAIYGTRGSNGVILITTKRGKTGQPRISYNGYYGVESLANKLEPMSPEAYVQKYKDYMIAQGLRQTQVLPNTYEVENYNAGLTTDWLKEATQTGRITEHNVSISGGTEKVQYYVTGGFLNQDGVVKGYEFQRASIRSNLDATLTDFLKVGTSLYFADHNSDGGRVNLLYATAMSPYGRVYNQTGNYEIFPMNPELLFENPLLGLTRDRLDRRKYLTGTAYTELTPAFAKGLKYRLNASYTYEIGRQAGYAGRQANNLVGAAYANNNESNNWVLENILTYNKEFGKHTLTFTGLYSAQGTEYFRSGAEANTFINDQLSFYNLGAAENRTSSSYGDRTALLSQMGRVNYSYDSRYLLTLTARRDGFSAFGANTDKYGIFPSMALGWNIASESFMQQATFVNQLKLRFSYGQSGNQAIGVNQTATLYNPVRFPFGGTSTIGVLAGRLGNADLNWETTTSANLGLDYGFLNNRIRGAVEVYNSRTHDLLLSRNIPNITGYSSVFYNLGEVKNRGVEFTISSANVEAGKFRWETDLNFSRNKNEIVDLYGDKQDDVNNRWFIGKSLGAVYSYNWLGVWQEGDDIPATMNAKPGDLKFEDINNDGRITGDDRMYLGSTLPKWYGGLTNTFHYSNFHLSIFLQTSQGSLKGNPDIYYGDEAGRRNIPAAVGYWTPENRSNEYPSLSYRNPHGYNFARDNSYVRIKDVRLSYTVPQAFLERYGINGLTIYTAGRNLYTFTDWVGWDPESNQSSRGSGDWTNNYPLVKSVSFGVNLTL